MSISHFTCNEYCLLVLAAVEIFDDEFKICAIMYWKYIENVNHMWIKYAEVMQSLLNIQFTCDCSLMFIFDSVLLLLFVVAHSFWKIEELGEAMEFLSSLAIAASAFSTRVLLQWHDCFGCWVIGWVVAAFWNDGLVEECICGFMWFDWWSIDGWHQPLVHWLVG